MNISLYNQARKALRAGDWPGFDGMLAEGWDIDQADGAGRSLLWYAAADGRWEQVEALMGRGASAAGAMEGLLRQGDWSEERFEWLAGQMATLDQLLPTGKTALHLACKRGWMRAAQRLLELGADPNARSATDMVAFAQSLRRFDPSMGEAMLASGLDLTARQGEARNTLAHNAVYWDSSPALRWLGAQGADLDAANARGETPLLQAVALGRVDCARFLMQAGAQVEARDLRGKSALYVAVAMGRFELALELIKRGADPYAPSGKNGQGRSPMGLAKKLGSGSGRVSLLPAMESQALESLLDTKPAAARAPAKSL